MKFNKLGIHKAMGGPRVDKCREVGNVRNEDERETWRELGLERADALSQTTSDVALAGPMQSSVCAEV